MYSQDGYKLIRAEQLTCALHAWNEQEITFRGFRAYIGCFELIAIREAANRSHNQSSKKGRAIPSYRMKELARLTGLAEKVIKKERPDGILLSFGGQTALNLSLIHI